MRTKLFFAFFVVIAVALISNLIFERLIMKDFDEYVRGTKDDQFYWVLASVEGSYHEGQWNMNILSESVHWGMMLGFDLRVEDTEGREVITSHTVVETLPPPMKRRMESFVHVHEAEGEFEKYPLFVEGREVGTLYARPVIRDGAVKAKEAIFMKRGTNFLTISFVIAGAGAAAMAIIFTLFLSMPVKRLKKAADSIARGDFSVRVKVPSRDEIGGLAESFNYMAEALEKEEALRRHLTWNIAHELRTPLAVMKAQVEAIIDGVFEDKAEGLENVRNEIENLTSLVEGIEDIAKAEASFFSRGEYREVSLGEFLKGVASSLEAAFRERGLDISVVERGDVSVVADLDKLERVVKNVISNSLKYTERGGVRLDYGREGRDFFFIDVKDTGMGIPEDELPKIFTRFYRGRGTSEKGIGIGLAIVKELVDVMGGRIGVESAVGRGTRFRISLPAKEPGVGKR